MAKAKTTAKRLSSCGPTLPNKSNEEKLDIEKKAGEKKCHVQ